MSHLANADSLQPTEFRGLEGVNQLDLDDPVVVVVLHGATAGATGLVDVIFLVLVVGTAGDGRAEGGVDSRNG